MRLVLHQRLAGVLIAWCHRFGPLFVQIGPDLGQFREALFGHVVANDPRTILTVGLLFALR